MILNFSKSVAVLVTSFFTQRISSKDKSSNDLSEVKESSLQRLVLVSIRNFVMATILIVVMYYAVAAPPLHLVYDSIPPPGSNSIYVPGGGFSGFWVHMGIIQSIPNIHDYQYYCYSSGCLSVVLALMNKHVDNVIDAGLFMQKAWLSGNLTRYDMVSGFLDIVMSEADDTAAVQDILPNLKILITTKKEGVIATEPSNYADLIDALMKTTWIPFITGPSSVLFEDEVYIDGGFSRCLHPVCEYSLDLPLNYETLMDTFYPGLTPNQARRLWHEGYHNYSNPMQKQQLQQTNIDNYYCINGTLN